MSLPFPLQADSFYRPFYNGAPRTVRRSNVGPPINPSYHTAIQSFDLPDTETSISVLHILAVHPSYHRLGLGTKLILPGLVDADRAGAQTYVEASPAGLPLYLRHGWEQVDEMVLDMRPYGGDGMEHQPFLMREPGAGSKLGKRD